MKKILGILFILYSFSIQAAVIEYSDAQKVLGQIKMVKTQEGANWFVWYKFQIRFSPSSNPTLFCYYAQLVDPKAYSDFTDQISVLSFIQTYGPLPNTYLPVASSVAWCSY